ncbi:MAG: hypothetical protein AAF985_00910 [Bacteroidota bacterium]
MECLSKLISCLFLLIVLSSCKSTFRLVSHQGNKLEFTVERQKGNWEGDFDKNELFQQITSVSIDTTILEDPKLFFSQTDQINARDTKSRKTGIWITGNNKMVRIYHYKKGKKHGDCLFYFNDNESVECHYKNGKLHGWYIKKIGKYTYSKRFYKKGVVKKELIVNPKW